MMDYPHLRFDAIPKLSSTIADRFRPVNREAHRHGQHEIFLISSNPLISGWPELSDRACHALPSGRRKLL